MDDRFVVTGCGRSGTKYMAHLLSAAGVECGHERAYNANRRGEWDPGQRADSSWMAATYLPLDVPVVLLVRHPLAVVKSWTEIGFFDVDIGNPTHSPLEHAAPWVYEYGQPADRALAMWLTLTATVLSHAEMIVRLEWLDVVRLGRLVRWAGGDSGMAAAAFRQTPRMNEHSVMRGRVGVRYEPTWDRHDRDLAGDARALADVLGYDPEVIPDG